MDMRLKRTKAVVTLSLLAMIAGLGARTVVAQASEPDPAELEAIHALGFLLGEWTGTSTTRMGPSNEATSDVSEKATLLAGGAALLLEGRGTMTEGGETRIVHDALGVVTWDVRSESYQIRAFRAGQGWTDSELEVEGRILRWGLESPGRTVRFTLDFSEAGRWHETGEIERGGQWYEFLVMDLRRAN